ncbi:MAG: hypothetical protein RBU23_12910 [Candidatus Auribacterota bacterium]|nr:hypothetical protein [Candidatus Auribacterota bacterium]
MIFLMAILLASFSAGAQKLTSVKPYGSKGLYEITPTNDTVSFTPKYSATAYVMAVDTNMVVQVDTLSSNPCNTVYFQFTTDATKRYVTFGSGLVAGADSIAANKSRTWGFVFIRGKYILMHRSAEY